MAQTQTMAAPQKGGEAPSFGPKDFVRTGPDTAMGRYLRRFWHPVYLGRDLKAGRAFPLRIMNEDFTLYRGEDGVAHILAPRCAHRCTQLSTGWVEGDSLRCFYHGWKYDPSGQCTEAPAEREGFADTVQIRSYPTEEYLGLIFAYLGEGDAPPLPRYPEFEKEGVLTNSTYIRNCNCYNNLESNMDSLHTAFVHRSSPFTTAGLRGLPEIFGDETEYGILKHGRRPDGIDRMAPFYWPNALHIKSSPEKEDPGIWADHIGWRVPIDDENHRSLMVNHVALTGEAAQRYRERNEIRRKERAKLSDAREAAQAVLRGEVHIDDLKDRVDIVNIQDYVAQVGQGIIPDFEHERLGRSDVLVALFRHILARELTAMTEGRPLKQWKLSGTPAASTGI
ncbi:MAG TPA: Rieske 2Fe-2S domain-containing protein [Alphaproteobacteria bacterium]|jgi:5,5'-dehydrodivanillate O-demethylase